jgi:hypothetical protein
MMDITNLEGKIVALIISNTEKENDVKVAIGNISKENQKVFFVNREKNWRIYLDPEQLQRTMPVTDDIKEILLGADFFIPMSVSALPHDADQVFIKTGLNCHE